MARVIAFTALGALRLSGAPVHEPVHGWQQAIPMTVTQRDKGSKERPRTRGESGGSGGVTGTTQR